MFLAPLLAAVLATSSPAANDSKPQLITNLEWTRLPSGFDFAYHYPDQAQSAGVSGRVILSCRVDAKGGLTGCKVAAEDPANYGFGAATLALVPTFQMKPPGGADLSNGRVHLPIYWAFSDSSPPPPDYRPGSPTMVVTIAPKPGKRRGFFACPSATDKARYCQAHRIEWEKQPGIEEIDDLIRKAHAGSSSMECAISDTGALEDCVATNNGPQLSNADFLRLSTLFKAPARTEDHVITKGNHVVLTFDWTKLANIVAVFDGT